MKHCLPASVGLQEKAFLSSVSVLALPFRVCRTSSSTAIQCLQESKTHHCQPVSVGPVSALLPSVYRTGLSTVTLLTQDKCQNCYPVFVGQVCALLPSICRKGSHSTATQCLQDMSQHCYPMPEGKEVPAPLSSVCRTSPSTAIHFLFIFYSFYCHFRQQKQTHNNWESV